MAAAANLLRNNMNNSATTIVKKLIATLRPHPLQATLFPPLSEVERQVLADDIHQHGLKHAVEVLPDDTIVCGHQRVAAAKLLGWEQIDCIVRDDLAAAGPTAIERYLIEDNLHRRQLSPLAVVRLYRHLKRAKGGKRAVKGEGELRDAIGQQLKMSGRTLDRYERVLDADPRLAAAVDRNELQLSQAVKVAALSAKEQQRILTGLAEGQKLRTLLRSSPPKDGRVPDALAEPYQVLTQQLRKVADCMESRRFLRADATFVRSMLEESRELVADLLDRLDGERPETRSQCGDFLPIVKRRKGRLAPSRS